jgi:arabinofuranosyltransferase
MPLNHIAIEFNGLIDPLIARMPKHPNVPWVPGGIVRIVPEGYLESLVARRNLIKDPDLARYYDVLILITQSDTLFTIERLTTIIRFNLGAYEPLRQAYITRILQNPPKPPEGL